MSNINIVAVIVSAIVVFFASTIWYITFSHQRSQLSTAVKESADKDNTIRPQPIKMLVEIFRSIILAWVIAYLFQKIGVASIGDAIKYGLLLWVGFPLILLTGSIMWENVPWKLAAIHSGDWLIKLLIISTIIGAWK